MSKHNAENERIKRGYFTHLKDARGLNEASVDAVAKAIHRFESSTAFRSFKKFHIEQAIAFRRRLEEAVTAREGKPLSKATILQILNGMRAFILWLAEQPGYRSRIRYSDADYFRLSEKDIRIAKAPQERSVPTPEQIESVLRAMPAGTDIERRNRALIAFTWLTGVRDGALASLKLKHVNLTEARVNQDPREVKTKNSKAQTTTFFPVAVSAADRRGMDRVPDQGAPLGSRRPPVPGDPDRAWPRPPIQGWWLGPQALEQRWRHPRHLQGGVRGCRTSRLQPAQLPARARHARRAHLQDPRRVQGVEPESRP
jgi:integrase